MTKTLFSSYHGGDSHLVLLCVGTGRCPGGGRATPGYLGDDNHSDGGRFRRVRVPCSVRPKGQSQPDQPSGRPDHRHRSDAKRDVDEFHRPAKTVTLNITGMFHQSTASNGDTATVVTGRNLQGDPDAGFVLAIGLFSFKFDKPAISSILWRGPDS